MNAMDWKTEARLHARLCSHRAKVEKTKETIAEALNIGPAYVACSWGKDSVALLRLSQSVQPDVPALFFVDAEQEMLDNYSEVISAYRARFPTNYSEVGLSGNRVPDKIRVSRVWERYPVALIGLRAEENRGRAIALRTHGLIHRYRSGASKGSWRACPLAWWSWLDVWAYTVANDLPYLDSYDHHSNPSRKVSRTCNLLAKRGTKGAAAGRIAGLKERVPEYFFFLRENYPEIASES